MNTSEAIGKLIEVAKKEVGYLEKKNGNLLDSIMGNAGSGNYTKYARDLYPALQGQAWCDMFVDWCFVQAFGVASAARMIGGFSAYTPTSANYYRQKKRFFSEPQVGDQIFFKNSVRIYHTGIVYKIDGKKVYTIEGNTSGVSAVVANGGGVYQKEYELGNASIAGYGRADWSVVTENESKYSIGWNRDEKGWWYSRDGISYLASEWALINMHWYYFGADGYMVTGLVKINDKMYYLEENDTNLLGALNRTNESGDLVIWNVS